MEGYAFCSKCHREFPNYNGGNAHRALKEHESFCSPNAEGRGFLSNADVAVGGITLKGNLK
jgi:hypothetical protein